MNLKNVWQRFNRPVLWLWLVAFGLTISGGVRLLPAWLNAAFVYFAVFIGSGLVLTERLHRDWLERLGLAFGLNVGLLAVPAAVVLVGHLSLQFFMALFIAINLGVVGLSVWFDDLPGRGESTRGLSPGLTLLTVVAAGLVGLIVYHSPPAFDEPNYLAFIRDALDSQALVQEEPFYGTGLPMAPRVYSIWPLLTAIMIRYSGLELLPVYQLYLPVYLGMFSVFCYYVLARNLGDSRFALFATLLNFLFLVSAMYHNSHIFRIAFQERGIAFDKHVLTLLLLPVAQGLLVRFVVKGDNYPALVLLALGMAIVHPLGIVFLGISFGVFGGIYFLFHWQRKVFWRLGRIGLILCGLSLVVWLQSRAMFEMGFAPFDGFEKMNLVERSLTSLAPDKRVLIQPCHPPQVSSRETETPRTLGMLIWTASNPGEQRTCRMTELSKRTILLDKSHYMAHPYLILEPVMLLALLVVPFLGYRAYRHCPTAIFLLGMTVGPLALMFNPWLTPLVGQAVTPWLIWRFSWLVPQMLILSYVVFALIQKVEQGAVGLSRPVQYSILPVCLILATLLFRIDHRLWSVWLTPRVEENPRLIEMLTYMRDQAMTEPEPATILADRQVSKLIPAFIQPASVVSYPYLRPDEIFPQERLSEAVERVRHNDQFFAARQLGKDQLEILAQYQVRYIILPVEHEMSIQLRYMPFFTRLYRNDEFEVYAVSDRPIANALIEGNSQLQNSGYEAALTKFREAEKEEPANPLPYLGQGYLYSELADWDQAIAAYQKAIRLSAADDPGPPVLLSNIYRATGNLSQAIELQKEALDRFPTGYTIRLSLADMYRAEGKLTLADYHYRQAADFLAKPDTEQYYLALARIYLATRQFNQAAGTWKKLYDMRPNEHTAFRAGQTAMNARQWADAETYLQQAIALDRYPWNSLAYEQLGNLYLLRNQPTLALTQFERSWRNGWFEVEARSETALGLARSYHQLDELIRAEKYYRLAAFMEPSQANSWIALGDFYLSQNRIDEAIAAYEKVDTYLPQAIEGRLVLAQLYSTQGKWEPALVQVDRAIDNNPYASAPYLVQATVYHRQNRFAEAEAAYGQALFRRPDDAESRIGLAALYQARHKSDQALAQYQLAVLHSESWAGWSYLPLGNLNRELGNLEEAEAAYRGGIHLAPNTIGGYEGRANWALQAGNLQDALKIYRQAAEMMPDSAWPYTMMGNLYQRQGDYEEAIAAYDRAVEIDINYLPAYFGLANLYMRRGEQDKASRWYEKALPIALDNHRRSPGQPYGPNPGRSHSLLDRLEQFFADRVPLLPEAEPTIPLEPAPIENDPIVPTDPPGQIDYYLYFISVDPAYLGGYLHLAQAYIDKGEPKLAILVYRVALLQHPQHQALYQQLGELYLQLGQIDRAIKLYEEALSTWPGLGWLYIGLADAYRLQGEMDKALATYPRAVEKEPGNPELRLALGAAYEQLDRLKLAYEQYRAVVELYPGSATGYVALARLQSQMDQPEKAIANLEAALEVQPGFVPAWLALSRIYDRQLGNTDRAIDTLLAGINRFPHEAGLYIALGNLYLDRGEVEPALVQYRLALQSGPDDQIVCGLLADPLAELRPWPQALDFYRQAADQLPACVPVQTALAQLYWDLGRFQEAIVSLRSVSTTAPADHAPYLALAEIYESWGESQIALELSQTAARLSPTSAEVQTALGQAYEWNNRLDLARRQYERAIELSPRFTAAYLALGRMYENNGDYETAIDLYNKITFWDQANPELLAALGRVYQAQGQPARLTPFLTDLSRRLPGEPAIPVALGNLHRRLGHPERAEKAYREALEIAPAYGPAWLALGELMQQQGRFEAAIEHYTAALRRLPHESALSMALGELYLEQGLYEEAVQTYRQISRQAPAGLVRAYLALGDTETALAITEQSPQLRSIDALPLIGLAEGYREQGQIEPAIETYKRALPSGEITVYRELFALYLEQGRIDQANQLVQQAVIAFPAEAEAYFIQGNLRRYQGDLAGAIEAYRLAINLEPTNVDMLQALSQAHLRHGNRTEAEAVLAEAAQKYSGSVALWLALGDLRLAVADLAGAEQAYQQAQKVEPGNTLVYIALARLQKQPRPSLEMAVNLAPGLAAPHLALADYELSEGNFMAAIAAYQAALELDQSDPVAQAGLIQAQLAAGHIEQALEQAEIFAAQSPAGLVEPWLTLMEARYLAGDMAGVEAAYQAGRESQPGNLELYELYLQYRPLSEAVLACDELPEDMIGSSVVYERCGQVYWLMGQPQAAISSYRQAITLNRIAPAPYRALSEIWLAQGQSDQAVKLWQEAGEILPDPAPAHIGLARIYRRQGRHAGAEAHLQKLDTTSVDDLLALARLRYEWGEEEAARTLYQAAYQREPDNITALLGLGQTERSQEALRHLEDAVQLAPTRPEPYLALADWYRLQGDIRPGWETLQTALEVAPGEAAVYLARANWPGRSVEARRIDYEQAFELAPTDLEAIMALADFYAGHGEPEAARRHLETALAAQPGNIELLIAQSNYYLAWGEPETADKLLQQAITLAPSQVETLQALARLKQQQNLWADAETILQKAVDTSPGLALPYLAWGDYHTDRGDWEAATLAYQQALSVAPGHPLAYAGLIAAYHSAEQIELMNQTAEDWQQSTGTDDIAALLSRGQGYLFVGEWAEAEQLYRSILERQPGNIEAYRGLAHLLQAAGQPEQALAVIEQARRLSPDTPSLYLRRGQIFEVLGNFAEAHKDYQQAARLNPLLIEPYLAEAALLLALDRPQEAARLYRHIISRNPHTLEAYLGLAAIQAEAADYPALIALWQQARQAMPAELTVRLQLAAAYAAHHDIGPALATLEEALVEWPDDPRIWNQFGQVYEAAADEEEAHRAYSQARQSDPAAIESYLNEGNLYLFREDNFEQSLALFEEAARLADQEPLVYDSMMGWYRRHFVPPTYREETPHEGPIPEPKTGIDAGLQKEYEARVQANPESVAERIRLAVLYENMDLHTEAIESWQQVIEMEPAHTLAYVRLGALYTKQETGRNRSARAFGQALALEGSQQRIHDALARLHHNRIDHPRPEAILQGTVEIRGTAAGPDFQHYKIEAGQPGEWTLLTPAPVNEPVEAGVLVAWDTTALPNGIYNLRLTVFDQGGNYQPWHLITVQIEN